jgi:hypothetical protein
MRGYVWIFLKKSGMAEGHMPAAVLINHGCFRSFDPSTSIYRDSGCSDIIKAVRG